MPMLDEVEKYLTENELVSKWIREDKVSADYVSSEYIRRLKSKENNNRVFKFFVID